MRRLRTISWNRANYRRPGAWYEICPPEGEPKGRGQSVTENDLAQNDLGMNNILGLFAEAWKPLDPQVAFVLAIIYSRATALGIKPLNELPPAEARDVVKLMQFYGGAGAPAIPHIEERTIDAASGKIRVRLYDPGTPAPAPAVVFLHGGGFVTCDIDIYDGVARQLAKRSGTASRQRRLRARARASVSDPARRLCRCRALGHPGRRDGIRHRSRPASRLPATRPAPLSRSRPASSCAKSGRDPAARRRAHLRLLFARYPHAVVVSAYGSGAYLISKTEMEWYWANYAQTEEARRDPLAAPLLADLKGLPPLYIAASECDVLRNDSEQLAERAKHAGVETEFRLWKGMIHACVNLMGWIDAMGPEVDRIGASCGA